MKLTEHQKEIISKVKDEGFYIQEQRQSKQVRAIKTNSTEVLTVDKRAFSKLVKLGLLECIGLNKCGVNYTIREGLR
jgi:hypothetical protein